MGNRVERGPEPASPLPWGHGADADNLDCVNWSQR
jgi:hypothetical protein